MILIIDNYDSFTYNLIQLIRSLETGISLCVRRNDTFTVQEVQAEQPQAIVISPGPGRPGNAGRSIQVIQALGSTTPILGICLGHQCIGSAFGARIACAGTLLHGKTSAVFHDGKDLFAGVPCPVTAARYHSLVVDRESLPAMLRVTAWTNDGTIMGLKHCDWPLFGLQFHPESFLTPAGELMIGNFLRLSGTRADVDSPATTP